MSEPFSPFSVSRRIALEVIAQADPLFAHAAEIRRRVFVDEQNVRPEEEWDEMDATARHLLILVDGAAAGTLRYYEDDGWLHVGRVAVLPEFRTLGLGRLLMERCLEEGRRLGLAKSFLNAQTDKAPFYRKVGYVPVGEEFFEARIPHCRMERAL